MHKTGQTEVHTTTLLFELIIGMLIFGILVYAVFNLSSGVSNFSKEYLEKDFLLLNSTLKSVPENAEVRYNTGRFRWEDGQWVAENLLSKKSQITAVKKENGEISIISE